MSAPSLHCSTPSGKVYYYHYYYYYYYYYDIAYAMY